MRGRGGRGRGGRTGTEKTQQAGGLRDEDGARTVQQEVKEESELKSAGQEIRTHKEVTTWDGLL